MLLTHFIQRNQITKFMYSTMSFVEAKIHLPNGTYLAYKKRHGNTNKPGIIFCSPFLSSLNGTEAVFLDEYSKKNNLSYVRFDYNGHGLSSGSINEITVSLWKQNTLDIIDQVTEGPQILIGSSIGAWLSILAAIERPERVCSVISIANAIDYQIQRCKNPTTSDEYNLVDKYADASPYWLEDAKKNSVFALGDIPIQCPVRLLHGMNDNTVPYMNSINVAEKILSEDVVVQLVKNAGHRFSTEENLNMIGVVLDDLLLL